MKREPSHDLERLSPSTRGPTVKLEPQEKRGPRRFPLFVARQKFLVVPMSNCRKGLGPFLSEPALDVTRPSSTPRALHSVDDVTDGTRWSGRRLLPNSALHTGKGYSFEHSRRLPFYSGAQQMPRRKNLATHPIEADGVSFPRDDRFVEEDYHNRGLCPKYVFAAFFTVLAAASVTVVLSDMRERALAIHSEGEFSHHADAGATDDGASKKNATADSQTIVKVFTGTTQDILVLITNSTGRQQQSKERESPEKPEATSLSPLKLSSLDRTTKTSSAQTPQPSLSTHPRNTAKPSQAQAPSTARPRVMWAPLQNLPSQSQAKHRCGAPVYTYCPMSDHRTYYYQRATHMCMPAIANAVEVCNHSPNRFASFHDCQERCLNTEFPAHVCFEKTRFSWCTKQDVNVRWWFFDGRRCGSWNFTAGLCPNPVDSSVFRSLRHCERRCPVRRQRVSGVRSSMIGRRGICKAAGRGKTCTSSVLRFPFFADVTPENGRVRCIRSSAPDLLTHRCLTGSNRFTSKGACQKTCIINGTKSLPNHIPTGPKSL